MKIVKIWEEQGKEIPPPFQREIKWIFAPDRRDVPELTFVYVTLPPGGCTDYHIHDRPELIHVVGGRGVCVHDGTETSICADMVLWVPTGEHHQIKNTGRELMKLANVFVPGHKASDAYNNRMAAVEKAHEAAGNR